MDSATPVPIPAAAAPEAPAPLPQDVQVAPWWHTAVLLGLVALISLNSLGAAERAQNTPRVFLYSTNIVVQLVMLGWIYFGVRRRGFTLRQVIGGRWRGFDDFLLDVAVAAGFWIVAMSIIVGLGYALGLADRAPELRKRIEFLAPTNALEYVLWLGVSFAAGFCEETVFRGYLQRQLASLTRSVPVGVLLASIVFAFAHGYQSGAQMLLVGVLGALLGTLAVLWKSVRPAMMAHAWQDVLAGTLLALQRRMGT